MKKITLSIDDAVLARARRLAAERGTSVNGMVRAFLARETSAETPEQYRARMELVELARNSDHGMDWAWEREEIYAERLSRLERRRLRGDDEVERPEQAEKSHRRDAGE